MGSPLSRWVRRCAGAAALVLAATVGPVVALPAVPALAAPGTEPGACQVTYRVTSEWSEGFVAAVTVRNLASTPWPTWRLGFTFPDGQTVRHAWNAEATQSGAVVTVASSRWARPVPGGGSAEFGFLGAHTAGNRVPTGFSVNDRPCYPLATVDNPFAGAVGYVNPDWAANVAAQAAATGGAQGARMGTVAAQPTAVWLDSIASITAGRGLRGHLDAALAQQQAAGRPVVISLVLYDLPVRACYRNTVGGEFGAGDLPRYRAEFVDPVAAILAEPRYAALRVAVVVEPHSLSDVAQDLNNLIERCAVAAQSGVYTEGIRYALSRLHPIANVFAYLDIGSDAAIGWDSTQAAFVDIVTRVAASSTGGLASVDGFSSNVAQYVPTTEPFLRVGQTVSGQTIRLSKFLDWNMYVDEGGYTAAMSAALAAKGFPRSRILIDTSRNGWGGPQRPTVASASTHVDGYVDSSRVDRRPHRSLWCNQQGAGLGALPQAEPAPHVLAYAWIKPPGESDGTGQPTAGGQERLCDTAPIWPPLGGWASQSNALPGAPPAGQWFPAQFAQLVANAHPSL